MTNATPSIQQTNIHSPERPLTYLYYALVAMSFDKKNEICHFRLTLDDLTHKRQEEKNCDNPSQHYAAILMRCVNM